MFDSDFRQIYHPRAMRQHQAARFARRIFALLGVWGILAGCDRPAATDSRSPTPAAAGTDHDVVTVVSLVPAATDLILGMDAGEHLLAVSNWDPDLPRIRGLPRVGDYRHVDWEKIAQLRPQVMIVQFSPEKMPPGMAEQAARMRIRLLNVTINRLEDTFFALRAIGEATGEPQKAMAADRRLRGQLQSVQHRVGGRPAVRTLISRSESAMAVVGGGNFMNDLLQVAGGQNVIETGENSYPTIDRERLLSLDPDAVLHLLPGASEQEVEQARAFWASVPQLSAVQQGRVHLLTEPYLLLPGYSVGRVAEIFASKLHATGTGDKGQP
jgi:iron complex transport system substrate-binding protein